MLDWLQIDLIDDQILEGSPLSIVSNHFDLAVRSVSCVLRLRLSFIV